MIRCRVDLLSYESIEFSIGNAAQPQQVRITPSGCPAQATCVRQARYCFPAHFGHSTCLPRGCVRSVHLVYMMDIVVYIFVGNGEHRFSCPRLIIGKRSHEAFALRANKHTAHRKLLSNIGEVTIKSSPLANVVICSTDSAAKPFASSRSMIFPTAPCVSSNNSSAPSLCRGFLSSSTIVSYRLHVLFERARASAYPRTYDLKVPGSLPTTIFDYTCRISFVEGRIHTG